jgi:DNA-binding GntR family transcriptional regulator
VASSPVEAAAEAVQQHIGGFTPESASELDRFLQDLPQLFERTAEALAQLADRFGSDLPVHPSVHEHLRELAAVSAGSAEFAEEAWSLHRTAHERELERIENPRPHEDMWDVDNQ